MSRVYVWVDGSSGSEPLSELVRVRGTLIEQGTIELLGAAMALVSAPLFIDLALCVAGNVVPLKKRSGARSRPVRLAVVVPAHEEEEMIARTVSSLRSAAARASDMRAEVFVVAHNCSDGTAEAAAGAGAKVVELQDAALRGKGAALRCGFQAATQSGANALLVVDADTVVSANLISAVTAALAAGAEAVQCRYEMTREAGLAGPMDRLRALAVRGMNVVRPRGRAGLRLSTGLYGNGFAITAETLERVPFAVDSIAEDAEYHVRLVAAGVRVEWLDEAWVRAELSARGSVQARQEARWEGGRLGVARRTTRLLLARLLHGDGHALEALADVWSLPLSRGILLLLPMAVAPLHWLHSYAAICTGVTLAYVAGAALSGPEPMRDLSALVAAPGYLAWRAAITPLVLMHSRKRAAWSRTKREAPQA